MSRTAIAQAGRFTVEAVIAGTWTAVTQKDTRRQALHAAIWAARNHGPSRVLRDGLEIVASYDAIDPGTPAGARKCVECKHRYAQSASRLCRSCERAGGPFRRPPVRAAHADPPPPPAPRPRRFLEVWIPGEGRRMVEVVWDGT